MIPDPHRRQRILIVEDSATQAVALSAVLDDGGFAVQHARNGRDALALLRDGVADLVLSDVVMPGMNGFELCRAIKADAALRETPVVLLTSLSDPMDIVRGLEGGADNYITKPYDPERLLARIRHVFDTRALRRSVPQGTGVDITFLGERFRIDSGKEQILDLLISSFEELVRTNAALRASEQERARQLVNEQRLRAEAEAARAEADEARAAAEEANRAKSEFLAMMSHDLRTPLNAIGGYADLLTMGVRGPLAPLQITDLGRIKRNQAILLSLVNDLLNFARLERGQVPLSLRDFAVDDVLANAHATVEPQLRERGLSYAYQPCASGARVHADQERVEQVLVNLLSNAVKFTPAGGHVILSCSVDDAFVAVSVSDTGVGIPAEKLEAIFDPFVQVDMRRSGERQGVGLGLAISRGLVQLMGGDLSVESVVDRGSRFTFTLPRR